MNRRWSRQRVPGRVIDGEYVSAKSSEYRIWQLMHQRCSNPKNNYFKRYGGRGISVCERWRDFSNFLMDMGRRPHGCTIDRIDNNGPYCKENCRWADRHTQMRNTSRTIMVHYKGVTMCVTDWALKIGLSKTSLARRISLWGVEEAMTRPRQKGGTPTRIR